VLIRLTYLAVTNAFAASRLLPIGNRDKDVEILAPRHQITVLERQLGGDRVRFAPQDRAFLAALLTPLPQQTASADNSFIQLKPHVAMSLRYRNDVAAAPGLCERSNTQRGRTTASSQNSRPKLARLALRPYPDMAYAGNWSGYDRPETAHRPGRRPARHKHPL
jgi:hypothetical protein